MRLSPAGHSFLRYSQQILALVDEARMVVAGDEPQGLFSLGSLESTAAVRISPTLAHFNQRYPKIHLALSTGPSGTMIDGVLEGNLSAAFVDRSWVAIAILVTGAFGIGWVLFMVPTRESQVER